MQFDERTSWSWKKEQAIPPKITEVKSKGTISTSKHLPSHTKTRQLDSNGSTRQITMKIAQL